MKLIVGLGNPGKQYEKTRHNLGVMVVEQFLKDFEPVGKTVWVNDAKFKADMAEINWNRRSSNSGQASLEKVILAKPKTYMNNSGLAVRLLTSYFKPLTSDIWIIHDELDLPLGSMKIRMGGSSAGHNGIESILQALGTEKFWRFRLGIGISHDHSSIGKHMIHKADEFVLSNFSAKEKSKARAIVKRGADAVEEALDKDIQSAMNRFNTK